MNKKKVIIIVASVLVGGSVFFGTIGSATSERDAIASELSNLQAVNGAIDDTQSKLTDIREELRREEETLKEFNVYKTNKESKDTELRNIESDIATKTNELTNVKKDIETYKAEQDRIAQEKQKALDNALTFSSGNYLVGSDIPEGVYDVFWVSGNGNVICSPNLNAIMGTSSDRYEKEIQNVPFRKDTILELKGGVTVKLVRDNNYTLK